MLEIFNLECLSELTSEDILLLNDDMSNLESIYLNRLRVKYGI